MNREMPNNDGYNSNAENRKRRPLEEWKSLEGPSKALRSTMKRVQGYSKETQPLAAKSFGLENKMKYLENAMAKSRQSNVKLATTPGLVKRVRRQLATTVKNPNYMDKLKRRNELSRLLSRTNRNERTKRKNRRELQSIEGDLLIMMAPESVIKDPRFAANVTRRTALFAELRKSNVSAADKRRHLDEINAIEKGMLALL